MSAAVICAFFAAACIVAHFYVMWGDQQRAFSDHIAGIARVGAVAMEDASQDLPMPATGERFTWWSRAVTADPAIVGAALLNADGEILQLQPEDLADRRALSETIQTGGDTIELDGPLGQVRLSPYATADGLQLVLFTRPPNQFGRCVASSGPFLLTIAIGLLLVLARLRKVFERRVTVPLGSLIDITTAGTKRLSSRPAKKSKVNFTKLAGHVADLIDDKENARARLGQVQHTVDARVAHQTRQIEAMLKRAERQAWIDPLTQLGNRRLLDDRLEAVFTDHVKRGEDMTVVLFDLDRFKGLNDTLGHAAGDELLSFVGELLRGSLRSSDLGLRLGGDEFAILLLATSIEEAARSAGRLIKLFLQRSSLYAVRPPVGISAGVASLKFHHPQSGADLVAAADAGLYRAKRSGKSRVGIVSRPVMAAASAVSASPKA